MRKRLAKLGKAGWGAIATIVGLLSTFWLFYEPIAGGYWWVILVVPVVWIALFVFIYATRKDEWGRPLLRVEHADVRRPTNRAPDDPPLLFLYVTKWHEGDLFTPDPAGDANVRHYVETRLSEAGVEAILTEFKRCGLSRGLMLSLDRTTPEAEYTVTVDDVRYTLFGRWFESEVAGLDGTATTCLPRVYERLLDIGWLPAGSIKKQKPFDPIGYQVTIYSEPSVGAQVTEREWPEQRVTLGAWGREIEPGVRCGVLSFQDPYWQWAGPINEAPPSTAWRSEGELYRVCMRPMLPSEDSCYDLRPEE